MGPQARIATTHSISRNQCIGLDRRRGTDAYYCESSPHLSRRSCGFPRRNCGPARTALSHPRAPTIILASIAAAVAAITAWSQHVETAADEAAKAAHAVLYDSDIGAELLGLILTVLFAAGWLCGSITWRRRNENARNGWSADLMHEPAKNKAITDWLWRQMIRRHGGGAVNADDFLDRLSKGVVRDLGLATLAMLALTAVLGALLPARVSYATARP